MQSKPWFFCILSSLVLLQGAPAISAPVSADNFDRQNPGADILKRLPAQKNFSHDPSSISSALPVSTITTVHTAIPADEMKYQSSVVTGNGFGFAVISPAGEMTKFYTHPFRFLSPNPDQTKDGPNTPNLVDRLTWSGKTKSSAKPKKFRQ